MEKILYRALNRKDRKEVTKVVTDHERSPLEWDSTHVMEDVRIEREIETLMGGAFVGARESWVMVAVAPGGEVVGSHWLNIEGEDEYRIATIISLYVEPRLRRSGVARRMKEAGELWARAGGAREIKTMVHLENSKMLSFNESLGFHRGMVAMKKKLF